MPDYRFKVTVEIDVTDADSEAQARKTVFSLLTAPTAASKGRPASGPKASVTGVTIPTIPTIPTSPKGIFTEAEIAAARKERNAEVME
jgi:hypothetical protein